jgi:hypothetical protein
MLAKQTVVQSMYTWRRMSAVNDFSDTQISDKCPFTDSDRPCRQVLR